MNIAPRHLVGAADADLLDTFLVSAVATVVIIRIFLEATGYPQLGGGGLHIAHVLWGGLGMLVAIALLLLYLSSTTRLIAAVVGGAGFGAFVDELGKFVTSDNDYFFRPTAAILYALFVILFLATREVRRFRGLSPEESLVKRCRARREARDGHPHRGRPRPRAPLAGRCRSGAPARRATPRQLSCGRAGPGPVRAPARDGLRRWPDLRGDRFEPLVSPDPGRDLHPRWRRVRPDRGLHGRSPRWGLLRRLGCTDRVGRGDERRDDRIGDPGDRGARGGCPDRERGVPAPTVPGQGLPRLRARDPGGSPFGAAVRNP